MSGSVELSYLKGIFFRQKKNKKSSLSEWLDLHMCNHMSHDKTKELCVTGSPKERWHFSSA